MIFSLIAVTVTFTALVIWVYRPSQRARFEDLGKLVFDTDPADQTVKKALGKQSFLGGAGMHHHFPCVKRWENARGATRPDLNMSQKRLVQQNLKEGNPR